MRIAIHSFLVAACFCLPALAQLQPGKVYSADAKAKPAEAARSKPRALSAEAGLEPKLKVSLPRQESVPDRPVKRAVKGAGVRKQQPIGAAQSLPAPLILNAPPGDGWQKFADNRWIWTAQISADASKGLRVRFTNLTLPEGAVLRVFSPASGEAETDHTAATLRGKKELWTETVFGETAVIECVLPANWTGGEISGTISEVVNRWKSAVEQDGEYTALAGACNLDVTCFPAWLDTSKAVVGISVVEFPLELLFTGTLLSDSNGAAGTDYVLSANHAVGSQFSADTLEFYWFYQTSSCNGAPPALASVPRTVGGARLIANGEELLGNDFSFVRLNNPPPGGVTYAGWTTAAPSGEVTTIHHPDGDFKRISFGNATTADHYWSVLWNRGTTEPGSSGAALFDSNQRVIGQLFGGGASCENPTGIDDYGRFDLTFSIIGNWLVNGPTAVANDNFASATVISGQSGSHFGSSAGATKELGEPDHAGNPGGMSVWFRWTAPATGAFIFTSGGSAFDTTMSAYVGDSVDALNRIAYNDDTFDLLSALPIAATVGTTYYIALDGYDGQAGAIQLNWAPLQSRTFTSAGGITIRDANVANPYPSTINVSAVPGIVGQIGVRFEGFTHSYLADIGVLVAAPSGENILLMDTVGDAVPISNYAIAFHPQATAILPFDEVFPFGAVWLPTTYYDNSFFTAPAPAPPYTLNMSKVFGADPNGAWRVFVEDYAPGDVGSITRWRLDLATFENPVQFTLIRPLGPDSFELRWRCIPAVDYAIQYKENLSDPSWTQLGVRYSASDAVSFVAPRERMRGFYRVEEL